MWLIVAFVFAFLSIMAEFQEYRARPAAIAYGVLAAACFGIWLYAEIGG